MMRSPHESDEFEGSLPACDCEDIVNRSECVVMKRLVPTILFLMSSAACADDAVTVPDLHQLSWQVHHSGKVYLRNLSQFDSTFLPCCFNHYIDTATEGGRTMWSAMLTNLALGKAMTFYVSSKSAAGPVTFLSNAT
jgi:hypothetical protein